MKRLAAAIFALLLCPDGALARSDSPIEVTAKLLEASIDGRGALTLTLQSGHDGGFRAWLPHQAELLCQDGSPMDPEDLSLGDWLRIEGALTPEGIAATRAQAAGRPGTFSLQGSIRSLSLAGGGSAWIGLAGLIVQVPVDASIEDAFGVALASEDLQAGDFVRASGSSDGEGGLIARRLVLAETDEQASRIRLAGTVSEILDRQRFLLVARGNREVEIRIGERTRVQGELAAGALARVWGVLVEPLTVDARRIRFEPKCDRNSPLRFFLRPDALTLGLGDSRRVQVVLRCPANSDTVFRIVSARPDIAAPNVNSLLIPAGRQRQVFSVASGRIPGRTAIRVSIRNGSSQELAVAVLDQEPNRQLRIAWRPRGISAAPGQTVRTRIRISRPAPLPIRVRLLLQSGDPSQLRFAETATIAQGDDSVSVPIRIVEGPGRAVIRAQLPEAAGGAFDDLPVRIERP